MTCYKKSAVNQQICKRLICATNVYNFSISHHSQADDKPEIMNLPPGGRKIALSSWPVVQFPTIIIGLPTFLSFKWSRNKIRPILKIDLFKDHLKWVAIIPAINISWIQFDIHLRNEWGWEGSKRQSVCRSAVWTALLNVRAERKVEKRKTHFPARVSQSCGNWCKILKGRYLSRRIY